MLANRRGNFIVKTAGKLKSITEQCDEENAKAKWFSDICPKASFFQLLLLLLLPLPLVRRENERCFLLRNVV